MEDIQQPIEDIPVNYQEVMALAQDVARAEIELHIDPESQNKRNNLDESRKKHQELLNQLKQQIKDGVTEAEFQAQLSLSFSVDTFAADASDLTPFLIWDRVRQMVKDGPDKLFHYVRVECIEAKKQPGTDLKEESGGDLPTIPPPSVIAPPTEPVEETNEDTSED